MVLEVKQPILCKSVLFLRHSISAQIGEGWWVFFMVFVFDSNAHDRGNALLYSHGFPEKLIF